MVCRTISGRLHDDFHYSSTLYPILVDSCQLRIIKFDVPSAKANGSSAVLHCDYDLEGSELYSVKFYKNSDGLYACEVSTEVLPQETLTIDGGRDYYRINEQLNFVCISGKGWPVLQLNWFINDSPAPAHYLTTYKPILDHDGLYRSKLGLHFNATQDYFQHDNLRLRCAATLTLIYELKAVEYLIDGSKKPKGASKRFTNDLAQINSKDIPFISGIRDKYNVNDTISLNCTTTAIKADLSWFINGKKVNSSQLMYYANSPKGWTILGIRLLMEKRYFQTEEIELRCVASFQKTIADFQEQVIIKTFNSEFYLSHETWP
ncbi:hypothetical protein RDWZM_008729 [Blomia tropicalis]|uniref:Ig-like domain-containing protein n=1 Tax=Blomia tropicalis TaxID=40697 RepID=A0A9Q0M471_BLOTA|nr:hypothetical protein RDWZM_008729 [Blomia tropicalis]